MRQADTLPRIPLVQLVAGVALIALAVVALQNAAPSPRAAPTATVRAASAAPAATATPAASAAASVAPRVASFTMTMTDAELTKAAGSSFPQTMSGVTVSEPDVRIESDTVRLTAKARIFFGTVPFVMTATPLAADGRITVRLDTATLAGVAVPNSTRASITDTMQATIAKLIPSNVKVTSVTFAPGVLTVLGTQP